MKENITVDDLVNGPDAATEQTQSDPISTKLEENNAAKQAVFSTDMLREQRIESIRIAIEAKTSNSTDELLFSARKINSFLVNGYWEIDKQPAPERQKPGPKPGRKKAAKKAASKKILKKAGSPKRFARG